MKANTTPEFRPVGEPDLVGKLYVVEYRGMRFDVTVAPPSLSRDRLHWELEIETQSRSVQNVRETFPDFDAFEVRLHQSLEAALLDAQQEIARIADAYHAGEG